jgi:hypothetical protein
VALASCSTSSPFNDRKLINLSKMFHSIDVKHILKIGFFKKKGREREMERVGEKERERESESLLNNFSIKS